MTNAQTQPAFWALTVRAAKDAVRLYFQPLHQITMWFSGKSGGSSVELLRGGRQRAAGDKIRYLEGPGPASKEDNDQFEQELAELARFTNLRMMPNQLGGMPWPDVQLSRIRRFLTLVE